MYVCTYVLMYIRMYCNYDMHLNKRNMSLVCTVHMYVCMYVRMYTQVPDGDTYVRMYTQVPDGDTYVASHLFPSFQ